MSLLPKDRAEQLAAVRRVRLAIIPLAKAEHQWDHRQRLWDAVERLKWLLDRAHDAAGLSYLKYAGKETEADWLQRIRGNGHELLANVLRFAAKTAEVSDEDRERCNRFAKDIQGSDVLRDRNWRPA